MEKEALVANEALVTLDVMKYDAVLALIAFEDDREYDAVCALLADNA